MNNNWEIWHESNLDHKWWRDLDIFLEFFWTNLNDDDDDDDDDDNNNNNNNNKIQNKNNKNVKSFLAK